MQKPAQKANNSVSFISVGENGDSITIYTLGKSDEVLWKISVLEHQPDPSMNNAREGGGKIKGTRDRKILYETLGAGRATDKVTRINTTRGIYINNVLDTIAAETKPFCDLWVIVLYRGSRHLRLALTIYLLSQFLILKGVVVNDDVIVSESQFK